MSFWSSAISGISNIVSGIAGSVPVVGPSLKEALNFAGKEAEKYEAKKATEAAQGWQQYMNGIQQQFSHDEAQLSRDFNAQEAQKSRDFNAQEAQKARDISRQWQLEDWERETAYNSPANQLKLMQDAGINPLLFNTSVSNNGMPSLGSPAVSSSSPASSSPAPVPSSGMLSVQNPSLIAAQTNLANKQAEKIEHENKKLDADTDKAKEEAEDLRQLRQGKLDLQNVEIHLGLSTERLNDATLKRVYKECLQIDTNIQAIKSQIAVNQQTIANMKLQGNYTQKQLDNYEKELQSRIAVSLSETAKNYGLANVSSKQCELLAEQITGQSIENGLIAIDFNRAGITDAGQTKVTISSNEHQQSIYDFETGKYLSDLWNGNGSVPYKMFRTATGYGAWITSCINVGLNANATTSTYSKKLVK